MTSPPNQTFRMTTRRHPCGGAAWEAVARMGTLSLLPTRHEPKQVTGPSPELGGTQGGERTGTYRPPCLTHPCVCKQGLAKDLPSSSPFPVDSSCVPLLSGRVFMLSVSDALRGPWCVQAHCYFAPLCGTEAPVVCP